MKKRFPIILLLVLCSEFYVHATITQPEKKKRNAVIIKQGFLNGKLSNEWKDALRSRMDAAKLDSFAAIKRQLSREEIAWEQLIRSKAAAWNSFRDSLAVPFSDIVLNDSISVMLGFLGVDDGFTYKEKTVCLDLTALYRAYGGAGLTENHNRIDRIFSHEYTHLLHKEWARRKNYRAITFRDEILWECLYEGIGMYRSLNSTWLPVKGVLPSVTVKTVEELYPVFTERIVIIGEKQVLTEEEKATLHAGLSRGPVNKKWGAFTTAIWLLLEAKGDDKNLVQWIDKGPSAIIELAKKYLPDNLKKEIVSVYKE
jgi:hypothetical protein